MNIAVENVIVSAKFPHDLDLEAVAKALPEARRQSRKFPGLVYKFVRPAVTVLIFNSGRMICTGGKSEEEAKAAIQKLVETLRAKGLSVADPETAVENMVVSTDVGHKLNIEALAKTMPISYEPEKFPGASLKQGDKTFLLFSSGRVVCVGAKTLAEAQEQLRSLAEKLKD